MAAEGRGQAQGRNRARPGTPRVQERETHHHSITLLPVFIAKELQGFCNYTCMGPELFNEMAETLQDRLKGARTWYITPLEARLQLAVL